MLGDDILRGVFSLIFDTVGGLAEMELGFSQFAIWLKDLGEYKTLDFILNMFEIVWMADLDENFSATLQDFYAQYTEKPDKPGFEIPDDLEFSASAEQMFHLWGMDDHDSAYNGDFKAYFEQFEEITGHEASLEDLVNSIRYSDLVLEMYRIRLVGMGLNDSLADGQRYQLHEAVYGIHWDHDSHS